VGNSVSWLFERTGAGLVAVGVIVFLLGLLFLILQFVGWWNHGIWVDGDLGSLDCIHGSAAWYSTEAGALQVQLCHDPEILEAKSGYQSYGARWLVAHLLDLHVCILGLLPVPVGFTFLAIAWTIDR
jgi:hypothetical protein